MQRVAFYLWKGLSGTQVINLHIVWTRNLHRGEDIYENF